jgi:hypothetical protein
MKKINKKLLLIASSLVFFILIQFYPVVESAQATCYSTTPPTCDDVVVTLQVDSGISISNGADVTMAPHLGVDVNSSIGSSAWTVITNNTGGYSLTLKASSAPALVETLPTPGANSFADYSPLHSGTPDYGSGTNTWAATANTYQFAYSAYGNDTPTGIWGTGASCGTGGATAVNQEYLGTSTSAQEIARKTTVTPVAGVTTNICFAAQQNGVFAPSGTYQATITGTAVAL